ncbi:MAG: TonB-dependent receptor [Vicinamibacterales bacterium]
MAGLAILLGFGCDLAGAAQAVAQSVSGSVRDASGVVLPGVTVTVTNTTTGAATTSVTGADGRYELRPPAGTYELRVEVPGFSPHVSEILVGPGPVTRDVTLAVPVYADTVVVTGTRSPEALRATPVAMTVVRESDLEQTPAAHYGQLLRSTPGVNTIELSARDIQISTRTAAGRNARTTLALLDGRTIYQDYFGMVLWDLLPIAFDEVKQVEVLRGPGSAIWGANALTGVINIITKSPKEMLGTRVRAGVGSRGGREVGLVHAGVRGRVGYKVSGSLYSQDPWERPRTLPDGTVLPAYQSQGTDQYKAGARVDVDGADDQRWRFDGGFASSSGVILVAVGPYDARTLRQGYGSVEYSRGSRSLTAFFNAHQSKYASLLGPDSSDIKSQLLQVEAKDGRTVGRRHLLVYGASFRYSHFDLSFVPDRHRREEAGGFVTDDIFVTDRLRLTGGVRLDWFSTFGGFASPRVGIRYGVDEGHTLRATYNRAYVAPSLVENFSNFASSIEIPLPTGPFALQTLIVGDAGLRPQSVDALEIGYNGVIGQARVSASWYRNATDGLIQLPIAEFYGPATPPPGWPLPREVLAGLLLPKTFVWSSVGNIDESGFELAVDAPILRGVTLGGTYSLQTTPEVESTGAAPVPVNLPPRHRASSRVSVDRGRIMGTAGVTFTDRAFWTDVLAFQGWTDSFWLLDATLGVRFNRGRIAWLVKGTNLADRRVQHHIFGDVIRRRVTTEIRFTLKD